ncbi:uncharacterized protein ARMOST_17362 [Armillaria ostoyae]|uniref:Uncharacterized protein n=1 Tax=Armillaria ostoyae TaxID=47428 RepID=A0A284RYR8_ARMOS|nr:uncharacterized protein ARMOST_17362 [Armillaria ostoyae]
MVELLNLGIIGSFLFGIYLYDNISAWNICIRYVANALAPVSKRARGVKLTGMIATVIAFTYSFLSFALLWHLERHASILKSCSIAIVLFQQYVYFTTGAIRSILASSVMVGRTIITRQSSDLICPDMAALDYLGPALANDLISHPINCLRDE